MMLQYIGLDQGKASELQNSGGLGKIWAFLGGCWLVWVLH